MNCDIQNNVMTLYQRVTLIVESLTYLALVLFSMVNSPELSIQMAKYIHNPTSAVRAISVCENKFGISYCFQQRHAFTIIGSNIRNGMLLQAFPASLKSSITSCIRLRRPNITKQTIIVKMVATIAKPRYDLVRCLLMESAACSLISCEYVTLQRPEYVLMLKQINKNK